jgi:hypothetical protein
MLVGGGMIKFKSFSKKQYEKVNFVICELNESTHLIMKNEIVLYRPNEMSEHIEVRLEDETVWLS